MSAAGRIVAAWERFFYTKGSTAALGVFRILFAYCLFDEVNSTRAKSQFAIEGGFHLPYVPFIQPIPEQLYGWIHDLQYPIIVLLGLGAFTRVSCGALLFLQGWIFFADSLNFRNHPYFLLLILLLILLSPARDSLSVRALREQWKRRRFSFADLLGPDRPLTYQRLIQLQVCMAYLFAATHKLHPYYLDGHVLARIFERKILPYWPGTVLADWFGAETLAAPENLVLPAMLTVAFELTLPFALWFRRTRPWAIAVGIAFHGSIAILMRITVFSTAMIATYLLFLEPATVRSVLLSVAGHASRAVDGIRSRLGIDRAPGRAA